MLLFLRGENQSTLQKTFQKERTNNRLKPHMALTLGLKPGPHRLGGECPHNCATMPVVTWYFQLKRFKVSVQKLDSPFSSVSVVKLCNRTGDHPVTFTHQF